MIRVQQVVHLLIVDLARSSLSTGGEAQHTQNAPAASFVRGCVCVCVVLCCFETWGNRKHQSKANTYICFVGCYACFVDCTHNLLCANSLFATQAKQWSPQGFLRPSEQSALRMTTLCKQDACFPIHDSGGLTCHPLKEPHP